MKTKYFILAAIAGMTFASCSNDAFVGDTSPTLGQEGDGSIQFAYTMPNATRADIAGNAAASLLGNNFYVTGTKGTEANDSPTPTLVFDNYLVHYGINTAGTTESNTANWEYVGIDQGASPKAPEDYERVKLSSIPGAQTIKYWDYSVPQYDFLAFSTGTYAAVSGSSTASTNIGVTAMKYGADLASSAVAYTFDIPSVNALENTFITDITEVAKANYGKEVTLKFKNLGSKVRIAIYETIPGYAVKDVNFYQVDGTTDFSGTKSTTAALISPSSVGLPIKGSIAVYFPFVGNDNEDAQAYNKASALVTPAASEGKEYYQTYGTLSNFASSKEGYEADGDYLGRTLPTATFAGSVDAQYYRAVFPVTASDASALTLRVDYTLVATDGSGEEINIYGAKAIIPSMYTQWQPNYAYTYIFKISDNTNGWTSPDASTDDTNPGLFPITFDAMVTEATDATAEQTTVTTVATPSITTYQQGHTYTINEYSKSQTAGSPATVKNVYVQVMDNNVTGGIPKLVGVSPSTLPKLNATNSLLYKVSDADATEAMVMDALEKRTNDLMYDNVNGRNSITLTKNANIDNTVTSIVNGVDDQPISVSAGEAAEIAISNLDAGTYAYVYDYTAAAKNVVTEYQLINPTIGSPISGDSKQFRYINTSTLDGVAETTAANEAKDNNLIYFSKTTNGTGTTTYSYVSVAGKTNLPAGLIKVAKSSLGSVAGTNNAYTGCFYFDTYMTNDGKYAVKVIKVVD